MLTFRQQMPSFFNDSNRNVDVTSAISANREQKEGQTLKMLTFRQYLRSYPFFRLEMLTFRQDLTDPSASFEACVNSRVRCPQI